MTTSLYFVNGDQYNRRQVVPSPSTPHLDVIHVQPLQLRGQPVHDVEQDHEGLPLLDQVCRHDHRADDVSAAPWPLLNLRADWLNGLNL